MTLSTPTLLLIWYLVVSAVAFFCYGKDKSLAKQGKWRIPESRLLRLGFLGGAVGALAGMKVFRHKTKHWYFWVINIAGLLWQVGVLVYFLIVKGGF